MHWCAVCCTRHGSVSQCPGELLATGPERHGRRITVATQARNEVYGVLIAETGTRWRARVLTYPNMLWSVPGGKGTLKFVGNSAQEVETQAVAFITQVCEARGYKIVEQEEQPESDGVEDESAAVQSPHGARDERHLRTFAVHYGVESPTTSARTADLSRGGLFIVTGRPLPIGSAVRLRLELESFTLPLRGEVVWVRQPAENDRPAGMGVQLQNPPPIYLRYVRELAKGTGEAAEG
jgi:uncharacterized protein (TIGR02266 family)